MSNFNSTIQSQRSDGRIGLASALNSQQIKPILQDEQHTLTISGDYDTMMTGNIQALYS